MFRCRSLLLFHSSLFKQQQQKQQRRKFTWSPSKIYNNEFVDKYKKYLRFGFDFVVAVVLVNLVSWSIGSPSVCLGPSMLPTINVE
jgi:hypothetical protein